MELAETIEALKAKGYVEDFNLTSGSLKIPGANFNRIVRDFKIDETYRFDEMTDPADQSVIYAISSEKYGLKGLIVNGFGLSGDPRINELIEKLR
jgi:hypothetical protein